MITQPFFVINQWFWRHIKAYGMLQSMITWSYRKSIPIDRLSIFPIISDNSAIFRARSFILVSYESLYYATNNDHMIRVKINIDRSIIDFPIIAITQPFFVLNQWFWSHMKAYAMLQTMITWSRWKSIMTSLMTS